MASIVASVVVAQNPIIRDQYSADPTARVFNGKKYVYHMPTTDARSFGSTVPRQHASISTRAFTL